MIHVVMDRKGGLGVAAVDRAGGSEYQMFYLAPSATLHEIQKTFQVAFAVHLRMLKGVAHPRLSGHMKDILETFRIEERVKGRILGEIDLEEAKVRMIFKKGKPGLFQVHVV